MDRTIEPATVTKIYNLLIEKPGLHLTLLAELLNMRESLVAHYLLVMKESGDISASRVNGFTRYYIRRYQGYYIRKSKRDLSSDRRAERTRTKIYNLIAKNPGLHLSKIALLLGMSASLAEYHLLQMERNDLIVGLKEKGGYYRRFYVQDSDLGTNEKLILAILRQKPLLKIVLLLLKHESLQHKEIVEKLHLSPSTVSYHLDKLLQNDIVDYVSYGKEKGYILKNTPDLIWLIRRYKLEQLLEGFKDLWQDLNIV